MRPGSRIATVVTTLTLVTGIASATSATDTTPQVTASGGSIHAEMLADHGGHVTSSGPVVSPTPDPDAQAPAPVPVALQVDEEGAPGPAGPLPNGLRGEVLGFLPWWHMDATMLSHVRLDLLSTIAWFSIGAQSDGTLARTGTGWAGWTSSLLTQLIADAHARGVRVVPTITMMAWDGNYAGMTAVLTMADRRDRLVDEIVGVVAQRGADGVNIDFEPVPASLRDPFTTFVRELKAGLVAAGAGSYVTVDTMGIAATVSSGYDLAALSAPGAADALMVMGYDFNYAGSARAGGVAPIESPYIYDVGDALADHVATVDPERIIWGVPHYGRAWNTTTNQLNSTVRSPVNSSSFVYHDSDPAAPDHALDLVARHGRRWDPVGQVPWVTWHTGVGQRQGYFDDPVSLDVKHDLVVDHGMAGIGIWSLGMDTGVPDLWDVIQDNFGRVHQRLAGGNRFQTAAAVSAASFDPGVSVAMVATGQDFPDALAAGPAAARHGGPVLLTTRLALPDATAAELDRLDPDRIVVVGGPAAVSAGVLAELERHTDGSVTRISGRDRHATAAAVSAATFPTGADVAWVTTGSDFPDALTGGVAASRDGGPILLVTPTSVPATTRQELLRLQPDRIMVLGGAIAVSPTVVDELEDLTTGAVARVSGANRYATGIAVSRATTPASTADLFVATGTAFPDGLAGTPAAATADGPLLLVPPTGLTPTLAAEVRRLAPDRIVVLGGPAAVPERVLRQLRELDHAG